MNGQNTSTALVPFKRPGKPKAEDKNDFDTFLFNREVDNLLRMVNRRTDEKYQAQREAERLEATRRGRLRVAIISAASGVVMFLSTVGLYTVIGWIVG